MTHAELRNNNIALKVRWFNQFFVLDLRFYDWRWVKTGEIISVKEADGERLYEVKKYETDGEKILVVVAPWEGKG
jgi:hypothetical protein